MTTPQFVTIAGTDLTVAEFNRLPGQIKEGNVAASLTVLAGLVDSINAGLVDGELENVLHGEFVLPAIRNLLGWYGDEFDNPIQAAVAEGTPVATTEGLNL
jgi:hypothetical protein